MFFVSKISALLNMYFSISFVLCGASVINILVKVTIEMKQCCDISTPALTFNNHFILGNPRLEVGIFSKQDARRKLKNREEHLTELRIEPQY